MILSLAKRTVWPGAPSMDGHDFTPPPLVRTMLRSLAHQEVGMLYLNSSDGNLAPVDTSTEGQWWVTVVDAIILALTICGALAILSSMLVLELKGRPSTTRMRIVQALILSDLMLGIVGLVGSAIELSPHPLKSGTSTCEGLGFMLVVVLWTEHQWTLILAVVTYLILIHPLHSVTIWLERKWFWLWGVVWVMSVTVAIIGLEIYDFYPSGGICYYGSNAGLYGELIQFIPRAIVFLVITVLYARLYVFLRRPDKIRGSYSNPSGSARSQSKFGAALHFSHRSKRMDSGAEGGDEKTHWVSHMSPRKLSRLINGRNSFTAAEKMPAVIGVGVERRPSVKPTTAEDVDSVAARDYASGSKRRSSAPDISDHPINGQRRPTAAPLSPLAEEHPQPPLPSHSAPLSPKSLTPIASPTSEIPPWERLELPAFEIDGQRYGGSAANPPRETSLWGGWKGLGGRSRQRPSTGGSTKSQTGRLQREADGLRSSIGSVTLTPAVSPGAHTQNMPSPLDAPHLTRALAVRNRTELVPGSSAAGRRTSFNPNHEIIEPERVRKASGVSSPLSEGHTAHSDDEDERGSQESPSETAVDRDEAAPKGKESKESFDPEYRRPSSTFAALEPQPSNGSRRSSASGSAKDPLASRKSSHASEIFPQPVSPRTMSNAKLPIAGDPEKGGPDEDDDEDELWDLNKMLAADATTRRSTTGGDGNASSRAEEEAYELVQESMASYLNRKTALLMLWFPLGYVLLFSVSLIRIIYDFAGDPPPALRAISRWFIFAQGILDALIYGLVEWHTKRVVRKRVRKGTFSPSGSQSGSALHHAFRNWSKSHHNSRRGTTGAGADQTQGGIASVGTERRMFGSIGSISSVNSRGGDPRSILQELGLGDTNSRRGSGFASPANSPLVPNEKEVPSATLAP